MVQSTCILHIFKDYFFLAIAAALFAYANKIQLHIFEYRRLLKKNMYKYIYTTYYMQEEF